MGGFSSAVMAIAMIAAFLLAVGGIRMATHHGDRRRGLLMLAAAAVLVGNVVIWTI